MDADGRFHGPGVSDNGAGLAALLAMARAWKLAAACPGWFPPRPAAGGQRGRRRRRQPAGHAAPVQAIAAGPQDRCLRGGGWRQHRTTSPTARWAAAASKWPSPDLAAIAGAITAWAIRCMRCAARWRCLPKRAWRGAQIGHQRGPDRRRLERQRHRPNRPAPRWISARKATRRWTNWWNCSSAAVERARELENQRATGGKCRRKLKEIGSRPAAALPEDARYSDATCAPWTRTWASARTWIALPPTPIFRCRWAFRPSPSAPAESGGGAHTTAGMVPPGRARPGPETHLSDAAAAAIAETGPPKAVNRRRRPKRLWL